jgi:fibronectin-binding autotransporter adhesin
MIHILLSIVVFLAGTALGYVPTQVLQESFASENTPTLGSLNVFKPSQGGTGIGSAVAGDVGKVLKVSNHSPFTYELASDNTGAGGGTFPFTPTTNYNALTNATGTPLWFQAGLQASSTSRFAALTSVNATTTNLDVSSLFTFSGVTGNSWDDYCVSITGSADLCDGNDATGGGGSAFPFTPTPTYNSTSTVIGFLSGLFSNSSTTLNGTVQMPSLSNGGLGINNGLVYSGPTSTLSTISGTLALTQLATQAANTVVANATGGSAAPTAVATSTFFGSPTLGSILAYINGGWRAAATTTFSSGLTYANGNVTADLGTSITVGEMASADFGDWTCNGSTCTVDANAITLSKLATQAANTVLANGTAGTAVPTALATSTFFGVTTPGRILSFLGGSWVPAATTTFSSGLTYLNGNVTADLGTSVDLAAEVTGDLPFANLAQVAANSVLANNTSATADARAVATSTLFGASVTPGFVLMASGGVWVPTATATCIQITGSAALCDGDDATASGAANDFTFASHFGAINAATSSVIWAQSGINASSTSRFVNASTSMLSIAGTPVGTSTVVCKQSGACEFNTIQAALNAGRTYVFVRNGVYSEQITGVSAKTKLVAESLNTIIQCNGATQSTCIDTNEQDEFHIEGFTVRETNGALLGVGFDWSNTAVVRAYNNRINNFGTTTTAIDTSSESFYAHFEGNYFFNPRTCVELSGTQANANDFFNNRCRPMAVDGGYGLAIFDARGFKWIGGSIEGTTTARANTGVYFDPSSRDNEVNTWLEAFGSGVVIAAGANNITIGGTVTSNGTDITDDGTNTRLIAVNRTGTKLFNIAAATSTTFAITAVTGCNTTSALTTTATGAVVCGAISGSGGAAFPFTPDTNYDALTNSTSTPVWFQAGLQASSTSQFNIVNVGTQSTDGYQQGGSYALVQRPSTNNVFVGRYSSLWDLTASVDNTFVGMGAFPANPTGTGAGNVIVGTKANASASSWTSSSTILGAYAGLTARGIRNTLLGSNAGRSLTSGTNNILIGSEVDALASNSSRFLNIGNLIFGTNVYNGTTPSAAAVDGTVGIATSTPGKTFAVQGDALVSGTLSLASLLATGTAVLPSLSSTNATTTNLHITGLNCTGNANGGALTADANGRISCSDDDSSAGSGTFPFTPDSNFNALTNSTSTPIWFKSGLQASSTSHFTDLTAINATTTNLAITAISGLGNRFLFANNSGVVGSVALPLTYANGGGGTVSNSTGALAYYGASSLQNVATTTLTLGLGLSYSGTLGSLVGGASGSLTIATSSLYAAGTPGQVLTYTSAGTWVPMSTTTFTAGSNVTLTRNGNSIEIAATGGSGSVGNWFTPSSFGATASNATSTLIGFENGLYALASSTIGNGTATGGLTVSGTATSTALSVGTNNNFVVSSNGRISRIDGTNVSISNTALQMSFSGGNVTLQNNAGGVAGSGIHIQTGTSPTPHTAIQFSAGGQERARFTGIGTFGFGTSTPHALFSIHTPGLATGATTTLFAIASSTANSTTTLFSISNTGTIKTSIVSCSEALETDASGNIVCGTDATGGGGSFAYPFPDNATSTLLTFTGGILVNHATSTITNLTTLNSTSTNATTTNLRISGQLSWGSGTGLVLTTSGVASNYAGTSCTNQFVRSLNASGAATCATVGAADVSLANLTATDTTLTFSGTYNGSTARTIGLNLGNANTWTARQNFANATSTQFSALQAYFGQTATSTFTTAGWLGVASTSPFKPLSVTGEAWITATTTTAGLNVLAPTTGTSTIYMYSKTSGFGGQIIMEDQGGGACTSVVAKAGVLTAAVVTCPTEI